MVEWYNVTLGAGDLVAMGKMPICALGCLFHFGRNTQLRIVDKLEKTQTSGVGHLLSERQLSMVGDSLGQYADCTKQFTGTTTGSVVGLPG